jgi:hypothetical protein
VKFADYRDELYRVIFEKKLHVAMGEYFEKLQNSATIRNYLTEASHAPSRTGQAPAEAVRIPTVRQTPGKRG